MIGFILPIVFLLSVVLVFVINRVKRAVEDEAWRQARWEEHKNNRVYLSCHLIRNWEAKYIPMMTSTIEACGVYERKLKRVEYTLTQWLKRMASQECTTIRFSYRPSFDKILLTLPGEIYTRREKVVSEKQLLIANRLEELQRQENISSMMEARQ